MHNIVFLDSATISESINYALPSIPHTWRSYQHTGVGDIIEKAYDASIIVNNKVKLDADMLQQLPNLQHVAITATGTNCIDVDAAKQQNITVSNVPNYSTSSVAEHVMAVLLGLRRNLFMYHQDIRNGCWQDSQQFCFHNQPIKELVGSTLGLIGTGAIAQQVASFVKAFGMQVQFHSVSGRENFDKGNLVSLDVLLSSSDIISVHCPLTTHTEHLLGEREMHKMKASAILINTSRGQIVDLEALLNALETHTIAGAAIDVAPNEPPLLHDPIMKLNDLSTCIVTPHSAWASTQAQQRLMSEVIANIEAFAQNNARNLV
ncbi:MAG: D-2-hydroxyacid dehydrogenase [Glaciecola sp.]